MIYGKKKIGKTTLTDCFSKNMFHLMVEPMARHLRVFQEPVESYKDLLGYYNTLKSNGHTFDAWSLETLHLFYDKSMDYTCEKIGIEHPADGVSGNNNTAKDRGSAWNRIQKDFQDILIKLLQLPIGGFFNCHESFDDIEGRDGKMYKSYKPEGGAQVWRFISAQIENIWYYHYRGDQRFLQVRGDEKVYACVSWTDKFITPSGELISAIPLGNNPQQGFENILKAFNNEQKEAYREIKVSNAKRIKK